MIKNILNLARSEVRSMQAYSSARNEASEGKIWLNANENPWSLSENERLNRYPDPQPVELVNKFCQLYGSKPDELLVTRGSDEGIDVLMRTFCVAGEDSVLICPPTYGMYKVSAIIQNAAIIEVPLIKKNLCFSLDVTKIVKLATDKVKIIFLCSPNNPTGNLLDEQSIIQLCTLCKTTIIVVDEAYLEFSKTESVGRFIENYPNLVVLRTLSKAYGLAGLRCGAVLANAEIIALLKKVIAPYPISAPIINVVNDCLSESNLLKIEKQINCLLDEKRILSDFLKQQACVDGVFPSDSNFLLVKFNNSKVIFDLLIKHGIVVRDRSNEYGLNNCLRITVGSEKENAILKEVLKNG